MKKWIMSCVVAVATLVMQPLVAQASSANTIQPLNQIVAVVNQEPITKTQLDMALRDDRMQLTALRQPVPKESVFRTQVLNRLIDLRMQLQLAKRNKVTVSRKEVHQAIARIAQSNGLSIQQFYARLSKGGISIARYNQQMQQQIVISKVQQQVVAGKINVGDAQVDAFMKKHHQQHSQMMYRVWDVLLSSSDDSTSNKALKSKANTLRKALVKSKSSKSDRQLIAKYGATETVMGLRPLGEYPDLFVKAISALKSGSWTSAIEAGNGWHILQLQSKKRVAGKNKLSRDQARQFLMEQKANKVIGAWLKELRDTAYIKIMKS